MKGVRVGERYGVIGLWWVGQGRVRLGVVGYGG